MKRRQFVQTSSSAAGATIAAGCLPSREADAADAPKPNLVIIHCDELNFRTSGCYRDTLSPEQAFMWGPKAVCETPHIDSLAEEGTLFTKCYAATPVCSPSRSSWISGQYPQNTPVTNNNVHLSDDVRTFAHQLGEAGYATGYAGKWHLDGNGKPQWGPERNFGFEDNRYMFNRGHWKQFEFVDGEPRVKARDSKDRPTYAVQGADEKSFATDWLMDRTIDFIDEHKDEPWAYMVSIPDPHGPDTVRAPYDTLYDDAVVEKPRTFDKDAVASPSWAKPDKKSHYKMAQYHGMMKCIDDNVGKLIAALKERDLYDNTIVVFTADHGDMRGEHRRQNKGIPLEASAKIPLVIRWPEKLKAKARIVHAINTCDFSPTILSLMGVEPTGKEEGRDLAAVFQGAETITEKEDITFMRGTTQPNAPTKGWIAAVTPTHKLILSDKDEAWLLDLEKDPDELKNFIADEDQSATVERLAKALRGYGEAFGDPKITDEHTGEVLSSLLS